MNNTERDKMLDYSLLKTGVVRRVTEIGSIENIQAWKKAYPEIDFNDEEVCLDDFEEESNTNIDWQQRTLAEKIFYVIMKKSPAVEISYGMVVEGEIKVTQKVDDSKQIWQMWLSGCFSDDDLDERALKLFIKNAAGEGSDILKYMDDLDLEKFVITRLETIIRPF